MKKLLHSLALLPLVAVMASCGEEKPNPANQRAFDRANEYITLKDVIVTGNKQGRPCPSQGNTRVLVIPVEFTDYPAETIGTLYNSEVEKGLPKKHYKADGVTPAGSGRSKEDSLEDIRKVYFGEKEETTWHSLRSYFQSASYGKQNFEGLVAPWQSAFLNVNTYTPVSAKEFKDNGGTAVTLAQNMLSKFYEGGYTQFKDASGKSMFKSGKEFLQYFDSDKDGCIDVVEMVYSAPFYASYTDESGQEKAIDNEMFWAYCGGTTTSGDVNRPKLSKWAWQSYYTTVEGGVVDNGKWRPWTCEEISTGVAKPDAHTIAHETGHAMGVPDYYDYDYKTSPLGGVDMQDHNVGDHSAHTKNWWGWSNPTVVTGPTTVTVRNFTKTGDCIMVPYRGYYGSEHYKGDTFNTEYISIELYSPTGVNEADAAEGYMGGAYPKCPQQPGIKVYHVDTRLGVKDYSSGTGKLTGITDTMVSTSSSVYVDHAFDNTGTRTVKDSKGNYQWMYEYLPNEENHKPNTARVIQDSNMFHEGDTFGYETYTNYQFHEYGNPTNLKWGYKFKIDSMTEDSATITFYAA